MSEQGLHGVALENSLQVRWRFLALGPGFRLGSFFSPRDQAALFLDAGGGFEYAGFRSALQGRIGVARQSNVGADEFTWFPEYEPYQGIDIEQGFAGARASLSRLVNRYEIAEIWIGLAAAYEQDFHRTKVTTPANADPPGEIEVVGGRRWLLGIEITVSIAPWGGA